MITVEKATLVVLIECRWRYYVGESFIVAWRGLAWHGMCYTKNKVHKSFIFLCFEHFLNSFVFFDSCFREFLFVVF